MSRVARGLSAEERALRWKGPGSDWVFAKLYAGPGIIDRLIATHVAPRCRSLYDDGLIDAWHFIRYADPESHLRLRMHVPDGCDPAAVLCASCDIGQRLQQDGLLVRFQLDTYEREIERFGGPDAIVIVEQIFTVDSWAAACIVERDIGDESGNDRAVLMMAGIDGLLAAGGLDLKARHQLTRALTATAGAHMRSTRRALDAAYRRWRRPLQSAMNASLDECSEYLSRGLADCAIRNREVGRRLVEWNGEDSSSRTVSTRQLLATLSHLWCNRLAAVNAVAQEQAAYAMLERHYESVLGRGVSEARGAERHE